MGQEDPLEQEMATHSSILAWRIPWTEEAGGLQSIGLQRVRQDWSDLACTHQRTLIILLGRLIVVSRTDSGDTQVKQGHISFWRDFEQLCFYLYKEFDLNMPWIAYININKEVGIDKSSERKIKMKLVLLRKLSKM